MLVGNKYMKREMYYTSERNVQILISLLKAHGIKRVIASPGTTNMTFVGSIQQDPFFEIWSSVDERSAAYLACGMASETGEPVVISCTGATASRNYMSGLTEAYYRKLPVLAVTSHRGEHQIGHLMDQQIDRRVIPNDVAVEHVTLPMVDSPDDEHFCEIEANKAILALTLNGGGPVHINMYTRYSPDFSEKRLPPVRVINRFTPYDKLPDMPNGKVGVFIGSHKNFTDTETAAIDAFCAANNSVVFCDHTSGYCGKYRVNSHLVCSQADYYSPMSQLDLMIQIGEISATAHASGRRVWRVSQDGAVRDTYRALTDVFMMDETFFFRHYTPVNYQPSTELFGKFREEYRMVLDRIPELPFGNIWMAQQTAARIPANSEVHMGIFNSVRSWSFFDFPQGVLGKCNVGGFGIDGGISSMIGASLVRPDKIFFGIFGDLAFFYDMNVLGNRHVGENIRVLLINNARGTEFRLRSHPCSIFGEDADPYMAAAGHFGNQSPDLVRCYAASLGYKYMSASTKEEYLANLDEFIDSTPCAQSIIFEVFTRTEDESEALELVRKAYQDKATLQRRGLSVAVRKIIGKRGVETLKNLLK